ncbi:MAG: 3-oxoacyl-[acyl-carrier-protein] reductase [Spirochaetales bacterium]|nr:3-oxoacyl-[acyl-carrier-protein] reductase [Spirochaetales bacterium]
MLLKDKKALVTGGARGIGKEIAALYLTEGAEVYIVDLNESEFMAELSSIAAEKGTKVHFKKSNVAQEEVITKTIEEIIEESGGVDICVNNAGITRDGLMFRMSTDDWKNVIDINLTSAFYVCRIMGRHMMKRKTGSIINMASVVGVGGNAGQTNYSASKAGLIGLTKSLSKEIASRNVRVNAIAPGFIITDMTAKLNEKAIDAFLTQIPMNRGGTPQEVANVALFLASDLSSYITGRVIQVDGGMSI